MSIAIDVARSFAAHWLSVENIRESKPVSLTFTVGKKTFTRYGARIVEVHHYTVGERAVTEGGKKAGEEYTRVRYLILGERPEVLKKRTVRGESKHVFRLPRDEGDWYCSHYYEGDCLALDEEVAKRCHPFGPSWGIDRWPHETPWHGIIDKYDASKRIRVPVPIEIFRGA